MGVEAEEELSKSINTNTSSENNSPETLDPNGYVFIPKKLLKHEYRNQWGQIYRHQMHILTVPQARV